MLNLEPGGLLLSPVGGESLAAPSVNFPALTLDEVTLNFPFSEGLLVHFVQC